MTNAFTATDGQAQPFAQTLFQNPSGISLVPGSAALAGHLGASSTFDSIDFGSIRIDGPGILLTTGAGIPPDSNTRPADFGGFGRPLNYPGDPQLTQIVSDAFPGDSNTFDSAFLYFKIDVGTGVKSIMFDIVFGSEEYPEFANDFVDIAAVFVNGKNQAFFNGDKTRPLAVLDSNLGYFNDNKTGVMPIEYDGVSNKLTVIAPVHEGINDIKIAIADTKDMIYDSGLFVANIRGSTQDLEGILNEVAGTDGKDKLDALPAVDNILIGGLGPDKLFPNTGFDILYGDVDSGTGTTGKLADAATGIDKVSAGALFKDVFVFKSIEVLKKSIKETDIIADFDKKDVINIAKLAGPKFEFIGKDKFSKDGDPEVRFKAFKKEDYTAVYIDRNGDGKIDVSLKLLGTHKLNEDDFAL